MGDWEADTVAGAAGGACLVTLVDRKSGYLVGGKSLKKASAQVSVSVNLFFTSFAKQAHRSRKGGFTGCANVFSPIPVTA